MGIRAKVIFGFLILLTLFFGASSYHFLRHRSSNQRLHLVNGLFLPLSSNIAQLQAQVQLLADQMRQGYFGENGSTEVSTFSRMARDLYPLKVQKRLAHIEQLLNANENQLTKSLSQEWLGLIQESRQTFDSLVAAAEARQFESHQQHLRKTLERLSEQVEAECGKVILTAHRESSENMAFGMGVSCLMLAIGLLMTWFSNQLLRPLPQLIASLRNAAEGEFDHSLKFSNSDNDEVSLLAREYNRMIQGLRDRDEKIQRQQRELVQSEKMAAVGRLSAEMVHEIRNPLNSINLNIDWLQEQLKKETGEIPVVLKSISQEIQNLSNITERYLARAKVDVSQACSLELNSLVHDILDLLREEHRGKNIQVKTQLTSQELVIRSDHGRMRQALINLIKNAKEAMPSGGALSVKTEKKENTCCVEITDNGHGMNEWTKKRSFHPFFSTKTSGTGIGLSLTRTIVEEAQGTIHCESRLGVGTTFSLEFPLAT